MMVQLNRRARTTGSRADEARNTSGLCFLPADRTRLPIEERRVRHISVLWADRLRAAHSGPCAV